MSGVWRPGQGGRLAPPGFEPQPIRQGGYVDRHPTTRRERLEDTMTIPVDTPEGRLAAIVYARVLGARETLNELARDLPLVHLGSPDELQAAP